MICLVCSHVGNDFGVVEAHGNDGHGGTYGNIEGVGSIGHVSIFVCMNCGALHTDMDGHIMMKDRKGES